MMRFQITFKMDPANHWNTIAVFLVEANDWDDVACKSLLLKQALGLNPEDVKDEIIYASDTHNTIRSGCFHRVETG